MVSLTIKPGGMNMNKIIRSSFIVALAALIPTSLFSQTPDPLKPSVVKGDVVSISSDKIVLKTDAGNVEVILGNKTEFKRVPPENPVLKAAVPAAIADIGDGDKLVVTGILSSDKKLLPARSVYLMTKSDIAKRTENETEKWRTRGISGKVTAIDPATNKVSVEVRGIASTTSVALTPKADARFLRYAKNSVKFSEALPSSIGELHPGDMIRALGNKSTDGASFTAEEIVSGAFQTIAGTVKSIDVAKNEVVINNAQTKKDVTIDLGSASLLKRFPEEMATRMAQFQGGGAAGGGGRRPGAAQAGPPATAPAGSANAPAAERGPGGAGRGAFGGAGRSGGIDDMLDRFPNITAADLKAGDVIAVSSTKNANVDRVTAIKLLAGVEPFLRVAQASAAGGQRGGSRGGQDGGFTIPGLDGFGGP